MNEVVERLVREGAIEGVPSDSQSAGRWVEDAERHLAGAGRIAEVDPAGSYVLCYDSARKSIAAVLLAAGFRLTAKPGAHVAVAEVAESLAAREAERTELRRLERLRRNRNRAEYSTRSFSSQELTSAADTARWILAFAKARIADLG